MVSLVIPNIKIHALGLFKGLEATTLKCSVQDKLTGKDSGQPSKGLVKAKHDGENLVKTSEKNLT